ncbi:hypothetical protein M5689_020811 [Euphorbia peplus]|nr:hypothetical protein M5689_020811 [Euphorbia peplus]
MRGLSSASELVPKQKEVIPRSPLPKFKWIPPPVDWLKLNCDASFVNNQRPSVVGFVFRDYKGSVLLCGAIPLGMCWSVEHAEILAIVNGIIYAEQCGSHKLIVASDSVNAIEATSANVDLNHLHMFAQSIQKNASFLGRSPWFTIVAIKMLWPTKWPNRVLLVLVPIFLFRIILIVFFLVFVMTFLPVNASLLFLKKKVGCEQSDEP